MTTSFRKNDFLKKVRKTLKTGKKSTGGRNNTGKITIHHRGGGHKRAYRKVDFKRFPFSGPKMETWTVYSIEYDPNRNAFLALCGPTSMEKKIEGTWNSSEKEKNFFYILAPKGLSVGDKVRNFPSLSEEISHKKGPVGTFNVGDALPLSMIPLGSLVHNIEKNLGSGGQLVRAAGTFAQIFEKNQKEARLRLPSGEVCSVNLKCFATIGTVGNEDFQNRIIGKAGRSRWLGIRPTVRGVAMNPVDHPHGGGEGKTSGGRPSVSPWGKLTK